MWVINREKERERIYITNEVSGLSQRVQGIIGETHTFLAEARYVLDGTVSGAGTSVIGECQALEEALSRVLSTLASCRGAAQSIDVREWVDDDEC